MPNILTKKHQESVNSYAPEYKVKSNTYNLMRMRAFTSRFGELTPFDYIDTVNGDKHPLRVMQQTRTYTLQAPLMFPIQNHRDYFFVPLQAMMPINYEKYIVNPVQGDDLPDDAILAFPVRQFYLYLNNFVQELQDATNYTTDKQLLKLLQLLRLLEYLGSSGSLMALLGLNSYLTIEDVQRSDVRDYFGEIWHALFYTEACEIVVQYNFVGHESFSWDRKKDSWSQLCGILFNDSNLIENIDFQFVKGDRATFVSAIVHWIGSIRSHMGATIPVSPSKGDNISIDRLIAYNMVCAEFYTNDKVDLIYNTERFWNQCWSNTGNAYQYFQYNDTKCQYDFFSRKQWDKNLVTLFSALLPTPTYESSFPVISFFLDFFGFKNTLKNMDYFTSCTTQPTAVGNVAFSEQTATAVTRATITQRFLNLVNHVGPRLAEYRKKVLGVSTPPDRHYPRFIYHYEDQLGTNEVDNNADQQGKIVTNVRSYNNQKGVRDYYADDYGVIIGINYHTIPLMYCFTTDRQIYNLDRFERYNPLFVGIGDQPIYANQYNATTTKNNEPFGYQPNYAEYRQAVSTMAGGFIEHLPGYLFNASRQWLPTSGSHRGAQVLHFRARTVSNQTDFDQSFAHFRAKTVEGSVSLLRRILFGFFTA